MIGHKQIRRRIIKICYNRIQKQIRPIQIKVQQKKRMYMRFQIMNSTLYIFCQCNNKSVMLKYGADLFGLILF